MGNICMGKMPAVVSPPSTDAGQTGVSLPARESAITPHGPATPPGDESSTNSHAPVYAAKSLPNFVSKALEDVMNTKDVRDIITSYLSLSEWTALGSANTDFRANVWGEDTKNVDSAPDSEASNIQEFCSKIASLPIDHEAIPLLKIAKRLDSLPAHQKAELLKVCARSIAHLPESCRMTIFEATRTQSASLPQEHHHAMREDLLASIKMLPEADSMAAFEAIRLQTVNLEPQLQAEALCQCGQAIKFLPAPNRATAMDALWVQSTNLPLGHQAMLLTRWKEYDCKTVPAPDCFRFSRTMNMQLADVTAQLRAARRAAQSAVQNG
jgi:hypothetical protein